MCDQTVEAKPSQQPEAGVMIIDWPIWVALPLAAIGFFGVLAVTVQQEKEHARCVRTKTRKLSDRCAKR
jgi:hypothetical protein